MSTNATESFLDVDDAAEMKNHKRSKRQLLHAQQQTAGKGY